MTMNSTTRTVVNSVNVTLDGSDSSASAKTAISARITEDILSHTGYKKSAELAEEDDDAFEDAQSDAKSLSTAETSVCASSTRLPSMILPSMPDRFLRGVLGDHHEAARRWAATVKWREDESIDKILNAPQPNFDIMKRCYPHYVHKQAKNGCYVYVELVGKGDLSQLWRNGLTLDDMSRHYVFVTEYIWNILDTREDGMLVSIFDIKGAAMSELAGNNLKLFKKCSEIMQSHYPERCKKMFVLNAPWWFQTAFAIISPFIDPRTKKKICVLGKDYAKVLAEELGEWSLPKSHGGTDSDEFGESPAEKALSEYVEKLNAQHNIIPTRMEILK